MTLYKRFRALPIEPRWLGLEAGDNTPWFCTPIGANIIGWENSIHDCFLPGFGETVFAVNPESCVDRYVYPPARDFRDFLRLILACGSTTAVEQINGWSRATFEGFLHSADNAVLPEQQRTLEVLAAELALAPMEDPYAYVRGVQAELSDLGGVRYSDDYYDTLGLERPDGTQPDMACMEFEPVTFRLERNGATFHD